MLHHLCEEAARQGQLVEGPALDPEQGREGELVVGAGEAVEPARGEEARGRGGNADEVEEAPGHAAESFGDRARRAQRDERGEGTGAGAELGRGLEEDKTTDALGMERGEDRRQCAAERVAGKEDAGVAGLAQYGVDSGKEHSVGVIGKAERRARRLGPFDEVDGQAMAAAALDDTDPRSEIPDIGALDRCRDDEENRAGGIAAIGAQLQSGQAQRDARGGWQRAEADRVEKPALALEQRVGLVQSMGESVEALLHGEALAEYLP